MSRPMCRLNILLMRQLLLLTNQNMKQTKQTKSLLFALWCKYIQLQRKKGLFSLVFSAIVWTLFLFGGYFLLQEAWWNVELFRSWKKARWLFPPPLSGGWVVDSQTGLVNQMLLPRTFHGELQRQKRNVAAAFVPSGYSNCKYGGQSSTWTHFVSRPFLNSTYLSFLPFMCNT